MSRNFINNSSETLYIVNGIYSKTATNKNTVISVLPPNETTYVTFTSGNGYLYCTTDYPNTNIRLQYSTVDTTKNWSSSTTYFYNGDEQLEGKYINSPYFTSGGDATVTISDTTPIEKGIDIYFSCSNATISPTKVKVDQEVTLTITASDGYGITSLESYYIDSSFDQVNFDFTINDDYTTATYTGTFPSDTTDINIVGLTTKLTSIIPINFSIDNATINISKIISGKTSLIAITCNSGYMFDTFNANYYDSDTEKYNSLTFSFEDNNTYASYTGAFADNVTSITISGTTKEITQTITPTFNISNATLAPTVITLGEETTLTITCNANYYLTSVVAKYDDTEFTFIFNSDNTIATYTGPFPTTTTSITINGETKEKETPTTTITPSFNIDNATLAPSIVSLGTETTLTITCNTNYYISSITANYYDSDTGNSETFIFTLNSNKTIATYTGTFPTTTTSITISGETKSGTPIVKLENDLIAIYIPTDKELGELGSKRFYTIVGTTVQQYDLGIYITSYHKIFLSNSDINILGTNSITLGKIDTGVYSSVTDKYIIEKNIGTIHIDSINNNVVDNNINAELILPFVGNVDIDINKIINKDVKIIYRVNIIDGNSICNVYSDETLIYSYDSNLGYEIPYIFNGSLYNSTVTSGYNFNTKFLTDKTAYLNLWYNEPINSYVNDSYIDTLKNLNGFHTLENVELSNINLTDDEYTELTNIFNEGVYF